MPDCVVLAAGASSRMGDWKPLLPWGSSTVAETVIATARSAGCRVILVTGNRGVELRERLGMEPAGMGAGDVVAIDNPDWAMGMTGSIQAALAQVRTEAFFVMHADMPLVEARVYTLLAEEYFRGKDSVRLEGAEEAGGSAPAALFASFGGRAGHPVLLPAVWIPGILGLGRNERMRDYVVAKGCRCVETGCAGVVVDLDTPEEYRRHAPDGAPASTPGFH